MRTALLAVVIGFSLSGVARAQDAPAPCGPKGQLPAALSANVASDSRCFEIRMYTVDKERVGTGDYVGDIDMLHQRFREEELAIFEKHGAEIIAVWQRLDEPDTLVWMLAYRDRAHRDRVWEGFRTDPAWTALLAKYNTPVSAEVYMMSATDYSALK